jgi:hypothetical protein
LDNVDDYLGYRVKVLHEFDQKVFDKLYEDCKEALLANLPPEDRKKELICEYFKSHCGIKAKLLKKLLFGVYHKDHPEIILFYCAAEKESDIRALKWGLTLFGNDVNGSKSWIWEWLTIEAELQKPFVESLGLTGYYYMVKGKGSIDKKKVNASSVIQVDSICGRFPPKGDKLFISPYGFGQNYLGSFNSVVLNSKLIL